MFFNKKSEPAATPAPVEMFEWDRPNNRSQSTRTVVTSWALKSTPMLKYPGGQKSEFTFEGRARLGTTPNVRVYGEIEIPIDSEPMGYLADRWQNLPEYVEGYAYLSLEEPEAPVLFVHLYCTAEAMEWVSRALVAGFSAVGGKCAFDLDLVYPDERGNDFWAKRWQAKTLQVAKWDVRASAER
jgi:hypothetical protein